MSSRPYGTSGHDAVLIGIEGGHAIEDSLAALSAFHRLGARYLTLTHTNTNNWADSSGSFFSFSDDPKEYAEHNGLTDFGRQVVLEMNRLGMLVDVSHVSDKTIADVLEVSRAPVFASHSSCRSLADMPRNLTDEQIKAIAAKGGVVMINFSSTFVDQKAVDAFRARKEAPAPESGRGDGALRGPAGEAGCRALHNSGKPAIPAGTLDGRRGPHRARDEDRRAGGRGPGHGLRRDQRSAGRARGRLEAPGRGGGGLRRGHSEDAVRGVLGENFLAFWERAEAARKTVPPRATPSRSRSRET